MQGRDPSQRAGLFRTVKLRFVAAQRLPRKQAVGSGSLPWPTVLVLIVIATMLCIYLFPLFSARGQVCCRPMAIRLPVSRHFSDLDGVAPVITVERERITIDGHAVPPDSGGDERGSLELTALGGLLDQRLETHRRLQLDRPPLNSVVLAADWDTSYAVLKPILRTCFDRGLQVQLVVQWETFGGG